MHGSLADGGHLAKGRLLSFKVTDPEVRRQMQELIVLHALPGLVPGEDMDAVTE